MLQLCKHFLKYLLTLISWIFHIYSPWLSTHGFLLSMLNSRKSNVIRVLLRTRHFVLHDGPHKLDIKFIFSLLSVENIDQRDDLKKQKEDEERVHPRPPLLVQFIFVVIVNFCHAAAANVTSTRVKWNYRHLVSFSRAEHLQKFSSWKLIVISSIDFN